MSNNINNAVFKGLAFNSTDPASCSAPPETTALSTIIMSHAVQPAASSAMQSATSSSLNAAISAVASATLSGGTASISNPVQAALSSVVSSVQTSQAVSSAAANQTVPQALSSALHSVMSGMEPSTAGSTDFIGSRVGAYAQAMFDASCSATQTLIGGAINAGATVLTTGQACVQATLKGTSTVVTSLTDGIVGLPSKIQEYATSLFSTVPSSALYVAGAFGLGIVACKALPYVAEKVQQAINAHSVQHPELQKLVDKFKLTISKDVLLFSGGKIEITLTTKEPLLSVASLLSKQYAVEYHYKDCALDSISIVLAQGVTAKIV